MAEPQLQIPKPANPGNAAQPMNAIKPPPAKPAEGLQAHSKPSPQVPTPGLAPVSAPAVPQQSMPQMGSAPQSAPPPMPVPSGSMSAVGPPTPEEPSMLDDISGYFQRGLNEGISGASQLVQTAGKGLAQPLAKGQEALKSVAAPVAKFVANPPGAIPFATSLMGNMFGSLQSQVRDPEGFARLGGSMAPGLMKGLINMGGPIGLLAAHGLLGGGRGLQDIQTLFQGKQASYKPDRLSHFLAFRTKGT